MANSDQDVNKTALVETGESARGNRIYRPLADIVEAEGGVALMLEMPGVAPEDVDITLERRVLTIRGQTKPKPAGTAPLVYREYGEGDYERAFTLSEEFDPERIDASLSNGVLSVTLPRSKAAEPKKITVQAG